MTMGENPGYRLRGVEVKGVSHSPTNAIKHNPAQIITDAIFLRGRKILRDKNREIVDRRESERGEVLWVVRQNLG